MVKDQLCSSAPRGSGHQRPGPEHLTTCNAAGLLAGLWWFAFSLHPSYSHGLADLLWFHRVPLMPHRVSRWAHLYSASTSFLWLRWSEDMDKRSVFMQMTCRFMWSLFLIILFLLLFYQFVLRTWRRRCHFFSWSIFNAPKTRILIIGFRHWLKYASSFSKSDEYDNSYQGWPGHGSSLNKCTALVMVTSRISTDSIIATTAAADLKIQVYLALALGTSF